MSPKRKVPIEDVVIAVKRYLAGDGGQRPIAKELGIDRNTFKEYVMRYKANGVTALIENRENNVYSEVTKRSAVSSYFAGEGSLREISVKYGLRSFSTLKAWIKVYNSGKGFRQKTSGGSRMKESRPTTIEERIQIAKDCIANGGNYGKTALKYKVSYQQVYQWTKKFKEMGAAGLEDRRGRRKKDQTPRTELEKAQIEIERLKHELYLTQMERDLLKKLDEIERREAYRK